DYAMNKRPPQRIGNRSHWYAPQGCYPCTGEDNWLVVTVRDDDEWRALCEATGHPEWASDERFADLASRRENHDALDELIAGWTREQDQYEAMHRLQKAGVTAAAVLNPKQALLDPHLRERGFFDRVETEQGPRPVPHQIGARFSAFEMPSARPAPKLGEHNREVLQGLLGMSDDEVNELEERKVIGDTPAPAVPLPVMRMFVQWPLFSYERMGALGGVEKDYRTQLGIEPPASE
ncbi:MAG: CoA transferase, partial [Chloroflexi bacterium]|nr:CoA transferase [Chloroflexota bacterium]